MKSLATLSTSVLALWLSASAPCQAQASRPADRGPEVIKLTLHPMPATQPALKYTLLPDVTDQKPGDAAPLYLMASRVGPDPKAAEDLTTVAGDQYRDMPMDQLARTDISSSLAPFAERIELLDLAARREDVRWDFALREQGAAAKLLHLREMRINARLISLLARSQIARHDWAAASHTLQTGFSMAHQLNDRPVTVQGLIEVGITELLLLRVREWTAEPDSPNLYWELSDLPVPFVDLRAISQWERGMLCFTFPALSRVQPEQLTTQEWHNILASLDQLTSANEPALSASKPKLANLVATTFPKASEFLAVQGMPKSRIDSLTPDQVVGIYFFRQYQQEADEMWKAWELPYWQGDKYMRYPANSDEQGARRERIKDNPMIVLIPSIRSARLQFARHERLVCVLRIIEAIRDFAAHHDGRLPASLDEVTALPVPSDPITGKPFPFQVRGSSAVLDAVSADSKNMAYGTRYELTIAR